MARPNRLRSWSISEQDGRWSLAHGHRVAYTGLSTRHAAIQALAGVHRPGEKVFETEPDGYQTDITAHLIRRHVLAGRPSQSTRGTVPVSERTTSRAPQRMQMPFVTAFGARRNPASPGRDPGKG